MILRYDGTLAGFLCLAGRALKERLEVTRVVRRGQTISGDLFHNEITIATDRSWAAKVASGLESRLGKRFLQQTAQALFSETAGIEVDLIELLRRGLREGPKVLQQLAGPLVSRINGAALKTGRERHRLLGLIRFSQLADNSYLAQCEPRCNIVPLLGSHFSKRLAEERWLIVDAQRNLGVLGEKGRWQLVENVELPAELEQDSTETETARLWRCFYQSVSNPARYNPKLRQQLMPKRYWSHLTEMQGK